MATVPNPAKEPAKDPDTSLAISTKKLNLWYGTFQALFNIDLSIRQGIITSMVKQS